MSESQNAVELSSSLSSVLRGEGRGEGLTRKWALHLATFLAVCATVITVHAQPLPQDQALTQIEALGGRVYRNSAGQVDMIDLKGDQITDDHLELLRSFPALRQLSLNGSRVTDRGLDKLLNLPNLEEVSLLNTKVTPTAAQSLNDRHPKVFHVTLSPPARPAMLAIIAVVAVPLAIWGTWLLRMTMRKQAVLNSRQYAQGIGYGLLLIVVAAAVLILGVFRMLGFQFN